jgi:hypothetical protein
MVFIQQNEEEFSSDLVRARDWRGKPNAPFACITEL